VGSNVGAMDVWVDGCQEQMEPMAKSGVAQHDAGWSTRDGWDGVPPFNTSHHIRELLVVVLLTISVSEIEAAILNLLANFAIAWETTLEHRGEIFRDQICPLDLEGTGTEDDLPVTGHGKTFDCESAILMVFVQVHMGNEIEIDGVAEIGDLDRGLINSNLADIDHSVVQESVCQSHVLESSFNTSAGRRTAPQSSYGEKQATVVCKHGLSSSLVFFPCLEFVNTEGIHRKDNGGSTGHEVLIGDAGHFRVTWTLRRQLCGTQQGEHESQYTLQKPHSF